MSMVILPLMIRRCCFLLALMVLFLNLPVCASDMTVNLNFVRGRVFFNSANREPYEAREGEHRLATATSLVSLGDGEVFLTSHLVETRLKQETILAIVDDEHYELRQGLAGFKVASAPFFISTAHLVVKCHDAVIVIKSNPAMTRVCVVKGRISVIQGRQMTDVSAGQEIAAAPQRLSKTYKQSDELRFTWYWVEPSREPALLIDQL